MSVPYNSPCQKPSFYLETLLATNTAVAFNVFAEIQRVVDFTSG